MCRRIAENIEKSKIESMGEEYTEENFQKKQNRIMVDQKNESRNKKLIQRGEHSKHSKSTQVKMVREY